MDRKQTVTAWGGWTIGNFPNQASVGWSISNQKKNEDFK